MSVSRMSYAVMVWCFDEVTVLVVVTALYGHACVYVAR